MSYFEYPHVGGYDAISDNSCIYEKICTPSRSDLV